MIKYTIIISSLFLSVLLLNVPATKAQVKMGYVDRQSILQKMPDFSAAKKKLQNFVEQKRKKITTEQNSFQKKLLQYRQRQDVMSDSAKKEENKRLKKLQTNISQDENQINKEIQNKRQALIGPLLQKINNAINKVAKEQNLTYVIDDKGFMSNEPFILYTSKKAKQKYNINKLVLKNLGIQ